MQLPGPARRAVITGGLIASLTLSACSGEPPGVEQPTAPKVNQTTTSTQTPSPPPANGDATPSSQAPPSPTSAPPPTDGSSTGPAVPTAGSDLIRDLTLCSDEGYDSQAERCTTGEAGFTSAKVHCSADIDLTAAGDVTVRWYREGLPFQEFVVAVSQDQVGTTQPFYTDANVGQLLLPAGTYTCEMELPDGAKAAQQAVLDGPSEQFSQAAVCDNADIYEQGAVSHCTSDAGTLPATTEAIGCSAVIYGLTNKTVEVRATYDTDDAQGEAVLGQLPVSTDLLVVHATMAPSGLGMTTFPAGDYSCQFLVDGTMVGEHPFTVG